jgi:predicted RNA-binding Zn ribbon-like protein
MAQVVRTVTPETIKLQGGRLCLDFANSVDWSADHVPIGVEEGIADADELGRWGRRMGIESGAATSAEFKAAIALREALHLTFAAIAHGEAPPEGELERITVDHAEATAAASLVAGDGAWRLDWPVSEPRRVRFAAVVDAVALLADPERLARVRQCPGRNCGWLFLDVSGRRHWCSMATCGSRAKMRRHYARQRGADA